jgi:hypothetical protein
LGEFARGPSRIVIVSSGSRLRNLYPLLKGDLTGLGHEVIDDLSEYIGPIEIRVE